MAGLSAMNDMRLNLSAPAVTALYLLTRGPIYDMYMLKLACMGAFLLMADVSSGEVGSMVLFVFLSTLLYIVVYAVSCLISSLVRRYKTR